jgi:hypothetical protein
MEQSVYRAKACGSRNEWKDSDKPDKSKIAWDNQQQAEQDDTNHNPDDPVSLSFVFHGIPASFPVFLLDLVHSFALHILKDSFSVFLLLFLDVVQHIAGVRIPELKYCRIISSRNVFFRHQHIRAHILI